MPFSYGGNLPYDKPAFSERMLALHLSDEHGAASRVSAERAVQLDWLWQRLTLQPDQQLYDLTCGPGLYAVPLAERGLRVTGIDFAPAAIQFAQQLATERGVAERCTFIQQDILALNDSPPIFDAALLLYGQLAVMPRSSAQRLLTHIAGSLKRGGTLCLEMLNPAQVDKTDSSWWFTDDGGLWGDAPFLHLGERFWDAASQTSVERYQIVHLDSGHIDEIQLADCVYQPAELTEMLMQAGFRHVDVIEAWDGLALADSAEWLVYLCQR